MIDNSDSAHVVSHFERLRIGSLDNCSCRLRKEESPIYRMLLWMAFEAFLYFFFSHSFQETASLISVSGPLWHGL